MMSAAPPAAAPAAASRDAVGPEPLPDRPGFSAWHVSGARFEVQAHYALQRAVGAGAYGVVAAAVDTRTGARVAIKKVPHAFGNATDALRVLREIRIMRHLAHENVLPVCDLGPPRSLPEFADVYIVSPLMDTDLHRVICSKQALSDDHVAWMVYQVLRGLKYVHSAGVIHRDLKPSNVLVNADCGVRICDLGLARGFDAGEAEDLTEYVVTRWYRAPEVMLVTTEYTQAIDVWSVGCIFAELLGGAPLFRGDDYLQQLRLIVAVLGTPSEEDTAFIKSSRARAFMAKQAGKPRVPFGSLFPGANGAGLDLLERMLAFNPAKRITVDAALQHPYLSALHSDADDVAAAAPPFTFDVGSHCDKAMLQRLLLAEVAAFHPEVADFLN